MMSVIIIHDSRPGSKIHEPGLYFTNKNDKKPGLTTISIYGVFSAGNQWSLVPERIRVQDKVTIIFADIVGFTQMSSGKSAAQLVELLSDLFGRFDDLCEFTGCEKLATLGQFPSENVTRVEIAASFQAQACTQG